MDSGAYYAILGELIMKKNLLMLGLTLCMLPVYVHARTDQDLKQSFQPASVVSVTNLKSTPEHYYEIGFRVNCALYVAKYKSANDYVPPALSANSSVNVRVDEHWMYVFLAPDRQLQLRLVSGPGSADKACVQEETSNSQQPIPAGTIVPVTLNSNLRSDRSGSGSAISATVMQDVSLGMGRTLRAGSKVTGHVVDAAAPGKGSDEARISFQFDHIQYNHQNLPVTTNLRAVASVMEVESAQVPKTGEDSEPRSNWTLVQIGGDQASYGQEGPVMLGSESVGEATSQGVLAHFASDLGSECRGVVDGDRRAQAFWLFSTNACGSYGLGDISIVHAGRTEPVGRVILTSTGNNVKVGKGSAMLLRVDGSGTAQSPVVSEVTNH
jgi:hypothetical protein